MEIRIIYSFSHAPISVDGVREITIGPFTFELFIGAMIVGSVGPKVSTNIFNFGCVKSSISLQNIGKMSFIALVLFTCIIVCIV
ncbi:TPA: hypothetical protein DIC40_05780 [Patescibacteria group bacterium]|nr:hypothetical protein [Candidatus Gracilibacteria bacterium]